MSLNFMGKKRGMTQLFDDKGNKIVCTVIEAEPNVITQIKTIDNDGYDAIQVGFEKVTTKDPRTIETRVTKPLRGHFAKANVEPRRYLLETRVEKVEEFQIGQEISVEAFSDVKYIDVTAFSIGKGYQGVIKFHNMAGGPASHGSGFHRHHGSYGMRSTPGRVLPGARMASHMGHDRITVQNLEIVMIDKEDNLIIVKGALPGPKNGLVTVRAAEKMHGAKKKSHK